MHVWIWCLFLFCTNLCALYLFPFSTVLTKGVYQFLKRRKPPTPFSNFLNASNVANKSLFILSHQKNKSAILSTQLYYYQWRVTGRNNNLENPLKKQSINCAPKPSVVSCVEEYSSEHSVCVVLMRDRHHLRANAGLRQSRQRSENTCLPQNKHDISPQLSYTAYIVHTMLQMLCFYGLA